MATTHLNQDRTPDNPQASPRFPSEVLYHVTRWFDLTASAVGCAVIYAGVLFSAGLLAAYLAALVPGITGVVVLFTVGPALIGTAPDIARRLCSALLDALESFRTT